jgi:glyoxylase-like metal-dependent hydrolase (beta-lactamase superfamily II)
MGKVDERADVLPAYPDPVGTLYRLYDTKKAEAPDGNKAIVCGLRQVAVSQEGREAYFGDTIAKAPPLASQPESAGDGDEEIEYHRRDEGGIYRKEHRLRLLLIARYSQATMLERLTVGPIGENAYILIDASACVLVDPGDEAERILSFLDSRGFVPSIIVATHGHLDHTAAIPELLAAWHSRGIEVPLAAHVQDADYFGAKGEETNRRLFAAIRASSYFKAYWRLLPPPDILLSDGDLILGSLYQVIHSPGHTRGSMCLYNASDSILVSGDTLFREGVGRTDGPDSDPAALARSLKRLFTLPPGTRVFPGHGEETTITRESGAG